jgi:hypothetical protein
MRSTKVPLQGRQTAEHQDRVLAPAWWRTLTWIVLGLALDWRCAFEWFVGKNHFYSALVLARTALIVFVCAGVSLLAVRATRATKWQHAWPIVFCLFSGLAYDVLSIYWDVQRR